MSNLQTTLSQRAQGKCELCEGVDALRPHTLNPGSTDPEHAVLICGVCAESMTRPDSADKHWFCLESSIWSEQPAVQALSWRLLQGLTAEPWASALLEQAYLEDSVLAWAKEGVAEATSEAQPPTLDSNGAALSDGDSVTLIKDLNVKGANFTAKRGTLVKNIRLGDDPELIEGRVNKVVIMLKTCFLKKA